MVTKENTKQRLARINRTTAKSLREFGALLEEVSKKIVPDQLVVMQKALALKLLAGVVNKTPVDTGRARGNWQLEIGQIPEGELDARSAAEVTTEAEKRLADLGFAQVVWIANNLEYVTFLEDGSSTQAPEGMLSVTLQELREEIS